jgi:sulfatase maturation enzyme AslB (radical SAM superfamily)
MEDNKMKIQSLSVVVPAVKCINDCKFCVAKMGDDKYKDQLDSNKPFYDLYQKEYLKRLAFARDNGCNTIMLTGDAEPQQNRGFLEKFGTLNSMLEQPFRWIEMQTTGVLLDDGYLRFLRNHVGVSTISISLSSFSNGDNEIITGMKTPVDIKYLCSEIKRYDFNLRLSLNLTKYFVPYLAEYGYDIPESIIMKCKELGADQVTFRKMYTSGSDSEQDKWLKDNEMNSEYINYIKEYIINKGTPLAILEFGATKYDVYGMSVVLDDDCMSQELKDGYKYLILRPDCKLYSRWDTKASLIF